MRVPKSVRELQGQRSKISRSRRKLQQQPVTIQALESRVMLAATAVAAKLHKHVTAPPQTAAIALNASSWTPIGPAPTTNANLAGGGSISGRIDAIATDPTNASVYYVGAAGGGIWKTTDAGATWTPLTDTQTTLSTGSIAIAPSAPNTIYVGTGDSTNSTQSYYGRGVLKSTNGGTTWTLLGNSVFDRKVISRVVVDPTNANTVYAAVAGVGTNGVLGNPNSGIFKSTDGGTTWTNTTTALSTFDHYDDLAMDPSNPQHLFAARDAGFTTEGVYTTLNGGTSWTLVAGGLPSVPAIADTRIAISPSNPQVVYVSFLTSDSRLKGIYKSVDNGSTWSQLPNVPDYAAGNGYYADSLIVDPLNANIVYAGGYKTLLQSTDGGANWTDITVGAGGTTGTYSDHHAAAFDASGRMLDGNDGGIFRLNNATPGSISWADLNTNLQTATLLSGSLDYTNPGNVFATGQDGGTVESNGSLAWTQRDFSGDSGTVYVDPLNPSRVYRLVPQSQTTAGNFIRRSNDGGATWTGITSGIDATELQSYYAGFAVDPANSNHLVFGTDRVYESYDGGNNWTAISTVKTNGWTVDETTSVAKLAIAPSDPHTIYATDAGHVFVTTNDGATWTQTDPNNSTFGSITVDPHNPKIVYATSQSFPSNKVMRSSDGGATWENISGNLPGIPTYPLVVIGSTIYVGNDTGVYASTDDGVTWTRFGAALPNAAVHDLQYDPVNNILAAFTFGRGAWEISTAPVAAPLVVNVLDDNTTPGDGLLSLREAITAANTTGQSISFDPSITTGTIALNPANGPLTISKSISITGPATGSITVNTGASFVEVSSTFTVNVTNLFLTGTSTALQIDSTASALLHNSGIPAGNITDNGTLNLYQFIDGSINGNITGSGSVVKNGPSALTLTGANGYTGGTTLRSGLLTGNTLALKNTIAVTAGATLTFDQSGLPAHSGAFSGTTTGGGNVRVTGGTLLMGTTSTSAASTLTTTGFTTIDSGATLIATAKNDVAATSTFIVNGNFDLGGFDQTIGSLSGSGAVYNQSSQPTLTATLTVGTTNSSTFTGVLEDVPAGSGSAGVLALKKVGTGTISLAPASAASTYTGGTALASGFLSGNTLAIHGTFTYSGGGLIIDQSLGNLGTGTFTGTISGVGTVAFNNGTVKLAPSTTINLNGTSFVNGTVIAGAANQINGLFVNGVFDLGGFDQTVGSIIGAGVVYNNEPGGIAGTATLTTGATNTVYAGTFADHQPGSGNLGVLALKINSILGTPFVLAGNNTYSGGTTLIGSVTQIGPSVSGDPLGSGPLIFAGGSASFQGKLTSVQQAVAVTGYNQDVVVDASATNPVAVTTASFDTPNAGGDFVWYEKGFGGVAAQGTGLPSGTTFTSAANPAVSFQLQPANALNDIQLPATGAGSITIPLVSPGSFSTLNFLAASANGNSTMTAVLNFADGSTQTAAFTIADWFNNTGAAIVAGGRIMREQGAGISLRSGNPRLYEYDVNLGTNQLKTLNSITFTQNGGTTNTGSGIVSRIGIFAISGTAIAASASQSYPNAVKFLNDATIDVQVSNQLTLGGATVVNFATLNASGPFSISGSAPSPTINLGNVLLNNNLSISDSGFMNVVLGSISDGGAGYGLAMVAGNNYPVVELAGTDTYSGLTDIQTGFLKVDGSGGLPGGALHIGTNATVRLVQTAAPFTSNVSALNIDAPGIFDITNNTLMIHYGSNVDPMGTIKAEIANGYHNGSWNESSNYTTGVITSRTAQNDVSRHTGIGYADSADGLVPLPANTIELKYTLYGDTGLSGTVGFTDFMRLTQHFTQSAGANWGQGDFNYDGAVDTNDFNMLAANYGSVLAAPTPADIPVITPPVVPARPPRVTVIPPPASTLVDQTLASAASGNTTDAKKLAKAKVVNKHH